MRQSLPRFMTFGVVVLFLDTVHGWNTYPINHDRCQVGLRSQVRQGAMGTTSLNGWICNLTDTSTSPTSLTACQRYGTVEEIQGMELCPPPAMVTFQGSVTDPDFLGLSIGMYSRNLYAVTGVSRMLIFDNKAVHGPFEGLYSADPPRLTPMVTVPGLVAAITRMGGTPGQIRLQIIEKNPTTGEWAEITPSQPDEFVHTEDPNAFTAPVAEFGSSLATDFVDGVRYLFVGVPSAQNGVGEVAIFTKDPTDGTWSRVSGGGLSDPDSILFGESVGASNGRIVVTAVNPMTSEYTFRTFIYDAMVGWWTPDQVIPLPPHATVKPSMVLLSMSGDYFSFTGSSGTRAYGVNPVETLAQDPSGSVWVYRYQESSGAMLWLLEAHLRPPAFGAIVSPVSIAYDTPEGAVGEQVGDRIPRFGSQETSIPKGGVSVYFTIASSNGLNGQGLNVDLSGPRATSTKMTVFGYHKEDAAAASGPAAEWKLSFVMNSFCGSQLFGYGVAAAGRSVAVGAPADSFDNFPREEVENRAPPSDLTCAPLAGPMSGGTHVVVVDEVKTIFPPVAVKGYYDRETSSSCHCYCPGDYPGPLWSNAAVAGSLSSTARRRDAGAQVASPSEGNPVPIPGCSCACFAPLPPGSISGGGNLS